MKNNGGFLIVMQIKLLFFVVCLFAITRSLAHQPVLNTTEKVSGCAMPTGHFIPEEDPKGIITKLNNFFLSTN